MTPAEGAGPGEPARDPDIEPDAADWTWVIERPCEDCGHDSSTIPLEDVGDRVRANAARWVELLDADRERLAERPAPDRWSPLEYACHVRDVLVIYDGRLERMLSEDSPRFDNWDQDATAVTDAYRDQDPAAVSAELLAAAEVVATRFDSVSGDGWERRGHRGDGADFTVATIAPYFLHDLDHHVWDVTGERVGGAR